MIKQNRIVILFFTICLTVGFAEGQVNQFDTNGKRHGLWTKNFEGTDQIRYSGEFNHGKEVDTFKFYTLSEGKSVLSAVRVFSSDSPIAKVSFYTSTGGLISEGRMNGKIYIGEWTYYHKNLDVKMITENYNDSGELDGPKVVYYKNGKIAEESTYKNGKLQGRVSWYSESGNLFKFLTYNQDLLEGPGEYYDPNGNLGSKGSYSANKKIGEWLYYKGGKLYKKINHDTNTVTKID
ncbi:toxin-antitoxin system YwqK family antitoxin [Winogradskyella aurantiaca]|uniref:toxin-antitoxin system YwqK family antitoxin n=1 Tax=Winogradskyella aurantiaca TaxID=2219558 RepID=UPI000E1D480C|nr:toxin-antitoxin system YwqK family antitoxin [Winogradskyella aurantiaca]